MTRLLSDLPAGSLVEYGTYKGAPVTWMVLDKDHSGYPSGSVTLLTKDCVTQYAFDAKEPNSSLNDAKNYGNNTYQYSNILQWLNSTAAAGAWYSAKHTADQSPSSSYVNSNPYDTAAGFLNAFTADELSWLLTTTTTAEHYSSSAVGYGTGATQTNSSKLFLLSCTEVGLAGGQTCGVQFADVFTDNASRIAKYNGSAVYWWLRDAYSSNAYYVRLVYADGTLNNFSAYVAFGVRPACNLKSNIWVSSAPNENGAYEILGEGTGTAGTLDLVYPSTPLVADDMPIKGKLNLVGQLEGAESLMVMACNNANDASPTWEDITNKVLAGDKFFFTNKEKTADDWGVQFRLVMTRGSSTADLYLSGASGTFE